MTVSQPLTINKCAAVHSNFPAQTTSSINIELGGPIVGTGYDRFVVSGTTTLDGNLKVTTLGAFNPAGNTFTVMTFGSGTGAFRTFSLPPGCNQLTNTGTAILVVCP